MTHNFNKLHSKYLSESDRKQEFKHRRDSEIAATKALNELWSSLQGSEGSFYDAMELMHFHIPMDELYDTLEKTINYAGLWARTVHGYGDKKDSPRYKEMQLAEELRKDAEKLRKLLGDFQDKWKHYGPEELPSGRGPSRAKKRSG